MNKELAWFLGWIATDGHIYKDRSRIQLRVEQGDKDVLEKIKAHFNVVSKILLESNNGIDGKAVRLNIDGNRYLYDMCFNIKSEIPEIPKELIRYFIRGLFEGDGSLYKEKPKKVTRKVQNVVEFSNGLKPLVEFVRDHLCEVLGLPYKEVKIDEKERHKKKYNKDFEPSWRIYWVGKRANLIAWYIWSRSEVHLRLDRKYLLYEDFVLRQRDKNVSMLEELLQSLEFYIDGDRIVIDMMANRTLEWAQRIQWITGLNLAPIVLNQHTTKGKLIKYYGLHIPKNLKSISCSNVWN